LKGKKHSDGPLPPEGKKRGEGKEKGLYWTALCRGTLPSPDRKVSPFTGGCEERGGERREKRESAAPSGAGGGAVPADPHCRVVRLVIDGHRVGGKGGEGKKKPTLNPLSSSTGGDQKGGGKGKREGGGKNFAFDFASMFQIVAG